MLEKLMQEARNRGIQPKDNHYILWFNGEPIDVVEGLTYSVEAPVTIGDNKVGTGTVEIKIEKV